VWPFRGDATRPVIWKIDIGYQLIEQTSVVSFGRHGTCSKPPIAVIDVHRSPISDWKITNVSRNPPRQDIEKDQTIISNDASRLPSRPLGIGRGISNWGHSPTAQIRVLLFLTLLPRRLPN
jgi:hypothetical protein